ncbi:hypothetical protein P3H15_50810 [Rhodococcus sp. T2V]|uniref:hypothetical protein n=1 Tax=Rhodococcus sp. T2V TaxID=3034164 RepID=UPI0023E0C6B8|nr:hypothetical protein [Rhodococcus sp. T2V]MDF3313212.1 hypothetical protein [Rhodococcus sp. T2V]
MNTVVRVREQVEFRKFRIAIDKAVPAELDRTWYAATSPPTNRHEQPAVWSLPIPPLSRGTGFAWMNQVERWFAYLIYQLVRRGVRPSTAALEKDVRD